MFKFRSLLAKEFIDRDNCSLLISTVHVHGLIERVGFVDGPRPAITDIGDTLFRGRVSAAVSAAISNTPESLSDDDELRDPGHAVLISPFNIEVLDPVDVSSAKSLRVVDLESRRIRKVAV